MSRTQQKHRDLSYIICEWILYIHGRVTHIGRDVSHIEQIIILIILMNLYYHSVDHMYVRLFACPQRMGRRRVEVVARFGNVHLMQESQVYNVFGRSFFFNLGTKEAHTRQITI